MEDSRGFDFGIYTFDYRKPVLCSCILFILFYISQALDFDSVLLDFGVSDTVLSRGKLIFVYIFGYFIFLIRFFLAFLLFIIIILVIVILVVCFFGIMVLPKQGKVESTSYYVEANTNPLFSKIISNVIYVGRYLAGFIGMRQYLMMYITAVPIFLSILYILYAVILYRPDMVEATDDGTQNRCMNTNHMYLFFIFISVTIMAFIYLLLNYILTTSSS